MEFILCGGSEPGVHFVLSGKASDPSLGSERWLAHPPHDKVPGAVVPFMSQPVALPLPQRGIGACGRVERSSGKVPSTVIIPDAVLTNPSRFTNTTVSSTGSLPAWEEGTELGVPFIVF